MKNKYKWIWICFAILTLALVSGSVVFTFDAYNNASSSKGLEAIKVFLLCLGGIGVVLSIYFTGVNLYIQNQSSNIENTFELISRWDDSHLLKARNWTRDIKKRKSTLSEDKLIEEIKKNPRLEQSIILVMNYLEYVRCSLLTKRIDKKLFYMTLGETLIDITVRFSPYIKECGTTCENDIKDLVSMLRNIK